MAIRVIRYVLMLSVLLFAGCKDNSYRGDWDEYDDNPDNKNLYPIWISVGPYYHIPTKAEDVDWSDKDIFVYAFKNDTVMNVSYSTTSLQDRRVCLLDGAVDGDMTGGKRGKRNNNDVLLYWPEGVENRVNYIRGSEPYTFYGYILDSARVDAGTRNDDSIELPITITGREDVMAAQSDPEITYDRLGNEFTEQERENIRRYSYSEYTAKYSIYPQLYFKHLLSKFRFRIVAGQMKEERTIHVENIRILAPSEATFVVAHKQKENIGLTFDPESISAMELKEKGGGALDPEEYFINTHQEKSMDVGDYVMVAPQTAYDAEVAVYEDETGRRYTNRIRLRIQEGSFLAGSEYLVTFTIFGIMDVRVDTELIGWIDGGSYEYDPEIKPNNIY